MTAYIEIPLAIDVLLVASKQLALAHELTGNCLQDHLIYITFTYHSSIKMKLRAEHSIILYCINYHSVTVLGFGT